ncbi:hypothetical protein OJ997_16160 [Solirubrobacter phytolaccae]|uniref:CSLREA domain-containing protein n=1 Tax=Solirubrobacter phytolaccae TaxID=1404360 RepID=A0A9X3N8P2_9ACTN|nr:choice-of-anchor Q domain-containing protein [Solirubrobacter phytolaccae]MDA0181838.1 hypothetical protein [Solirubrobacter phytolaccae]
MRRLLLTTVGAMLLGAAPAHAETFQVNTALDTASCDAIACSLRGALAAAVANGVAEDDVINLPAGTYAVPELSVSGANARRITVSGAGANATFVQPAGATRVFSLSSTGFDPGQFVLRGLTVRGGRPASGAGGNISASSIVLGLEDVRITDGRATAGGGLSVIGASGTTGLVISRSLIDTNAATGVSGGNGGGISMPGQTFPFAATITDSTIAFNTAAGSGAGISITSNSAPTLRGATVAFNTATAGVGGIQSSSTAATIQGSIFAGNRGANNAVQNCSFNGAVTDQGGNIEDSNQCGAATAASRQNTEPQLATALDGSQPPALAVVPGSPAVDFAACAGRTLDQRSTPRPQGALCDAGAYEYNPPPSTAVAGAAPPFTFSSSEAGSTFECSLDGGPFVACASPYNPGAAPGTHTLAVRAVDAQGVPDPNPQTVTFTVQPPPTATPTVTPSPTPTPVVNRTVVVAEVKGTVKIKRKGSKRYVDLNAAEGIPVGSSVDTRKGTVELTSVPKAGAPPEKARFYDGLFTIAQSKGITTLKLSEQLARCPKGKASAAAKKAKKRKLWGDGKGAFRTQGKYSAATVRGTKWLVEDSCAGTLTRVTQGSVRVEHGKKRIIVRAGGRYLAKPR